MTDTPIKNAYKAIDNEQYMKEFLHHMVDNMDNKNLKELYDFCIAQFYAKLHEEVLND